MWGTTYCTRRPVMLWTSRQLSIGHRCTITEIGAQSQKYAQKVHVKIILRSRSQPPPVVKKVAASRNSIAT